MTDVVKMVEAGTETPGTKQLCLKTPVYIGVGEGEDVLPKLQVLVRDREHDVFMECFGEDALEIIRFASLDPVGDVMWVKGSVTDEGVLLDKDTLTRDEPEGWE